MNYGKKGIKNKQKALNSKSIKLKKMVSITVLKVALICIASVGIIGLCFGFGVFKGIIASAPDISTLNVMPTGYTTIVYDSEGHESAKLVSSDSNRRYVGMDKIPENLAHAFVAIEDERFYDHNGIDIKGIIRAGVSAIKNRGLGQGASTITQQLLKNNVFKGWTDEKTGQKIRRKIQEQYLALELEKQMNDKDKILEYYMNTINLGQGTLGVQAASLRYFNKPAYQLSLSECAVIAAITQNPSKYNPISRPEKNAERREKVLNNMLEQGYISQSEYEEALKDDVYSRIQDVNEEVEASSTYTYFVDKLTEQVLDDFKNKLGYNDTQAYNALYSGGLSIYTTQDPKIQSICNEIFSNEENYPADVKWYLNYELTIEKANGELENHSTEMYKAYFKKQKPSFNLIYSSKENAYAAIEEYKAAVLGEGDEVLAEKVTLTAQPQVSITVEDQHTGHIVALVGGRGVKEASRTLNRATNTVRQPGSTFKVLSTYAPALDSAGLTLATTYNDAPYNYANGRPVNNWYNGYKGLCSLRYGIEQSLNIVTVKALTKITPQLGFDYLENFGFTTLVERKVGADGKIYSDIQQPMALGGLTDGVTNMELNAGYATIANNGLYVKPILYTKIVDHDGNILLDNTQPETRQVLKETTAFLLTDAMVDVVTKGTGAKVNFGNMSIAGKTGTTTKDVDAWFSGFTPYYTATTWAGYDNNESLGTPSERALAKTLWRSVMSKIHADLPNKPFDKPAGIVAATVCSKSGKLPVPGLCDATLTTEYFEDGTVPTESCNVHYQGMICTYSGLPAQENCPFQVAGTLELIPEENLGTPVQTASIDEAIDPATDPNQATLNPSITYCPHDATFFLNPNYEAIIQQQQAEMQQRALQAQQAAGQPIP